MPVRHAQRTWYQISLILTVLLFHLLNADALREELMEDTNAKLVNQARLEIQ